MNTITTLQRVIAMTCAGALAALGAGCGNSVSGTYSGKGSGMLDKLEFKSGGKVELSFMGAIQEGTFVVEDQRVKISNAGSTQIFKIDDKGCLDAGAILGRYCKL